MVKVRLGLIAFANDGGLGAQTRRLAQMLKPDRIMVVDSSGFSRNKEQHFEWYKDFNYFVVNGFPNNDDVKKFLPGLTHVLAVENPYNFGLVYWGQKMGIKILVQSNYEFCDNLDKPWLPVPDLFLMPSHWKVREMRELYQDRVKMLPPPIDPKEFAKARSINLYRKAKKRRFLHVIGTAAMEDRNGTLDLLEAVKLSKADFELVIKTQHPLSMNVFLDDPRVTYEIDNVKDNNDLYSEFDVLLLPRRWGGLSLTMDEAMMSALPVLTTDISPNNDWLPKEWLVESVAKRKFIARSSITCYSVDHKKYADKIDEFANMSVVDMAFHKGRAYGLAARTFSPKELKRKYLFLLHNRES